jgi:hypothetical protein
VPDDDHTLQIQRIRSGKYAEIIDAARHILKRPRPAAARLIDAAVLKVPGCDAQPGQSRGERGSVLNVGKHIAMPCFPTTAMEDDGHWHACRYTSGQSQIAKLFRLVAVMYTLVRRYRWQRVDLLWTQERSLRVGLERVGIKDHCRQDDNASHCVFSLLVIASLPHATAFNWEARS